MSKREQHFRKIEALKEHIQDVPTEELARRYNCGFLRKEGAIAIRETLAERGEAERLGA